MQIRVESSTFLAKTNPSGVGYYSKMLADAIAKNNIVDCPTGPLPNKNTFLKTFNRLYGKMASFNIAPPFDLFLPSVDLTIFPNFSIWPTLKTSLRATVIHDLTYLHHPELVEAKNLAHLKRVVPRSIRKSDFVITVSDTVKKELVEHFSIDSNRILVTPIPPDGRFLKKSSINIVKKYKLPTKKYILFIGNQEPRKNISCLIKAYSNLPQSVQKEYCLVIGGGSGWGSDKDRAVFKKALDAGSLIKKVGYIPHDELPAFYQQASVFVMPSLYEGFGMPVLEAMASSTPVIASDIPIFQETAQDAALYFTSNDCVDLSERILRVLADKELCLRLKSKSRKQLRQLSWSDNVNSIKHLVNEIKPS